MGIEHRFGDAAGDQLDHRGGHGHRPGGDGRDVDRAVVAARQAFPAWAKTSVEERAKFCSRIADGLQARMDEIATLVSQEVGMVKPLSLIVQAGLPLNSFNAAAQLVERSRSRRRSATR